jgi:hypothetical protein
MGFVKNESIIEKYNKLLPHIKDVEHLIKWIRTLDIGEIR